MSELPGNRIDTVGYITVDDEIVISDPYYPLVENNNIVIRNIKHGRYVCMVKYIEKIIKSVMFVHETINLDNAEHLRDNWITYDKLLVSRDGMIGIFKSSTYFSDEKYRDLYNNKPMNYLSPPYLVGDIWYNVLTYQIAIRAKKCIKSKNDFAICTPSRKYKISTIEENSDVVIIKITAD